MYKIYNLLLISCFICSSCDRAEKGKHVDALPNVPSTNIGIPKSSEQNPTRIEELKNSLQQQLTHGRLNSSFQEDLAKLMNLDTRAAMEVFTNAVESKDTSAYAKQFAPVFATALLEKLPTKEVLEWLQKNKEMQNGVDWKNFAIKVASLEPQTGLAIADKLETGLSRKLILACISSLMKNNENEKATSIIDAYTNTVAKDLGYFAISNNLLTQKDLISSLMVAKKISPNVVGRANLLGNIFQSLFLSDKQNSLTLLDQQTHSDKIVILTSSSFKSVFFNNVEAAEGLRHLSQIPLTESTSALFKDYLNEYAKRGSTAVIDFVANMPASSSKTIMLSDVFYHFSKKDPEKALQIASELQPDESVIANRAVVRAIAEVDFNQTLTVINKLPSTQRIDAMREFARTSTNSNPANAIHIIENTNYSNIIGTEFRSEMINYTVQNWARKDREAAKQWVEKLPAADQPKGTQGLITAWMKTDPIAASDWLSKQPAGPARDAGAREIIKQIKDTDPATAKQWRDSMTPTSE